MKNSIRGLSTAGILIALMITSRAFAENNPSTPTVTGTRIVLPPGSVENSAVTLFTVAPRSNLASHVSGRLVWDEDLTVRIYTPVTGRVRQVLAYTGDEVAANAVLARLDSPDFAQAQADAHKASADLTLAQRNLTRLQELLAHGAVAKKEVDEAEDIFESAHSEQQRANARLTLYGEHDAHDVDGAFALCTPIAGVIVDRNINVGEELRPDLMLANDARFFAPLFVVTNPRQLWVALDATETELPHLKKKQPLRIRSRAFPERVFEGVIEMIGSSLEPSTRTVRIIGLVQNPDLLLKAELYVDVEIGALSNAETEVVVDSSAVFSHDGHASVFLEITPGTYEVHVIEVDSENAGEISVRNGLSVGQHVVAGGRLLLQSLLEDGGKS